MWVSPSENPGTSMRLSVLVLAAALLVAVAF
ncbi:hypothetical protein A2cp1_2701 [Anaeromyxobacter dehalogenans 2CP-1]|uniref:Uncharacterized protein n=1 Tax=Anaeromyxobacter dehalogenans (strain ATCC BAA-258 / DSM 21875 / 2CP-1) TaxID=455488 RepID=B8JDI9_ANAD2|nr:hypothetical protein A2cp1_2701 [Anaeromyxobacter dehalogenans 2CP-1]